jgi:hypothetical protein
MVVVYLETGTKTGGTDFNVNWPGLPLGDVPPNNAELA